MLAWLAGQGGAAGFGPLLSEVALPENLGGRPIWAVAQLPSGELGVAIDGVVATGFPGAPWSVHVMPNGHTPRAISPAYGRVLVAGGGFCGFLEKGAFARIDAMRGEYVSAEPVPEGWLVSGRDGVWLVTPAGAATQVSPPLGPGRQGRLVRWQGRVLVTGKPRTTEAWLEGRLVADPEFHAFPSQIVWIDDDVVATGQGITDLAGRTLLPAELNQTALRAGLVGVARIGEHILEASYVNGLVARERISGTLVWRWQQAGGIYCLTRYADGFLVGTSTGLYALADPSKVEALVRKGQVISSLAPRADDAVEVADAEGTLTLSGGEESRSALSWPEVGGATVEFGQLRFGGASAKVTKQFVCGLSVVGDVAAVAFSHGLVLLHKNGERREIDLPGVVSSLANDGRNFLAGTSSAGVQVLSPQGTPLRSFGHGRVTVSQVRPGRVIALAWTGEIMDGDGNVLGRTPAGNPRAAAALGEDLVILITQAEREPFIGVLKAGAWQPLEVPGLAFIQAHDLAANDRWLFVGGENGLLRVRLPLAPAAAPVIPWRWSGTVRERAVHLGAEKETYAEVLAPVLRLPPWPSTFLRLRNARGEWTEFKPGASLSLPVAWGRTPVTLQADRNGIRVEDTYTIVRPWPWWLRAWAWPLHTAVLAGMVFSLSRFRTRRLDRRNRELELRVAERTEQLRKANAAKEEFLAGISHEIRNPLNGVVGICAILAERPVGAGERTLLRTLGGCADQLRSMLDDILDFSRIERGALTVTNSDFELTSLVEEAARVMDPELTACALLLPDHPVWLHGDSGKLRQLVCNLVSNALKYGVPREAGIEARIESAGSGRSRVRISVRNSGPTIPADEIPRLFNSFQRGARTTNIPGSGLGLAVCRRLMQAIGGRITAASVDGVTEFAIEVVLANAQPPAPAAAAPAPVSRALAIEDEDYNRVALGHVLHSLGYEVDWAVDGASALKLARENQYDLVLTDWRLPDMEGGELCKRLLALLPEPKPPVVAVTAYSTREKLEEARLAGMTGFVTKPVTKEKLERVIRGVGEALRPRRSLDTEARATSSPLASLGDLAPTAEQLSANIAAKWRNVATMARLGDPRTAREAHALRSLLLLAAEETSAEQIAILETAADANDWDAVAKVLPFAMEEITASQNRLRG